LIIGQSEAAQDISYAAMTERQQALLNGRDARPAVASVGAAIGAGGETTTVKLRPRVHFRSSRVNSARPVDEVIARPANQPCQDSGDHTHMQAAQDITIGGRVSKTQYQYYLWDDATLVNSSLGGTFPRQVKAIPGIADVTTEPAHAGQMLDRNPSSADVATKLRYSALHHRQHPR